MKTTDKYKPACYSAFQKYLENEDFDELMNSLYDVSNHARTWLGGSKKDIWFRFFDGDTLATTIQNIYADFQPGNPNKEYMKENLRICVLNKSLKIYYS